MSTTLAPGRIEVVPLEGIPAVAPGDDLAALVAAAIRRVTEPPTAADVLVVCQKVVSKAEGRIVALDDVAPCAFAREWAEAHDKDPRVVEVVLGETRRIVRMVDGVMICETRHGLVCANAGVDSSNATEAGTVTLLPLDADASASRLRDALRARLGVAPGVIVSDTFGRPWREGQVDVAIGLAGVEPLRELRGATDWSGRELAVAAPAIGDMVAAAAGIAMTKDGGVPAVLVRGLTVSSDASVAKRAAPSAAAGVARLLRDPARDLFR